LSYAAIHIDRELFARIAKDDEVAFRQVFHTYTKLLLPFVQKLTGSPETSKEVIQSVFLEVWQRRENLERIQNPKAWIIRLASNIAINHLRKKMADGRLLEHLKKETATGDSPEEDMSAKEMAKLVQQAVQQLSPQCKKVYMLSREEGLTIPQIAEALQSSPNTVKNQLIKALKDIRSAIRKGTLLLLVLLSGCF
jgi:RNA polymerase sigma-70 factor (ECF subfamily)